MRVTADGRCAWALWVTSRRGRRARGRAEEVKDRSRELHGISFQTKRRLALTFSSNTGGETKQAPWQPAARGLSGSVCIGAHCFVPLGFGLKMQSVSLRDF